MNRQIKYRVWDGEKMMPVETLCFSPAGAIWFAAGNANGYGTLTPDFPWAAHNQNPPDKVDHLMQYTGLKDKNGREIWEGDIVRDLYDSGENGPIGVVRWVGDNSGDYACRGGFSAQPARLFDGPEDNPTEVLGDIYRNPDLLK